MSKLFGIEINTINYHLKEIFETHELEENRTIRKIQIVQKEGNREVSRKLSFYSLDAIIAVGYRVKLIRGTQFRIWANKLIKEYLIKGYNLNVDRFKNNGGGVYFEEVLEKIKDIRSSEKVF